MRRFRGYAVAAALLVAAVGACTGDGGSGPGPTSGGTGSSVTTGAASPSTTSSPSTTTALPYPTDVPAEARANTEAGAIAFATYFFAQLNKAYTTPQAGLISRLSTANCKSCAGYEETATGYVQEGKRYDRAAVDVLEVGASPGAPAPKGTARVDVVVHQLPARLLDSRGVLITTMKDQTAVLATESVFDGGWLMDSVKVRAG